MRGAVIEVEEAMVNLVPVRENPKSSVTAEGLLEHVAQRSFSLTILAIELDVLEKSESAVPQIILEIGDLLPRGSECTIDGNVDERVGVEHLGIEENVIINLCTDIGEPVDRFSELNNASRRGWPEVPAVDLRQMNEPRYIPLCCYVRAVAVQTRAPAPQRAKCDQGGCDCGDVYSQSSTRSWPLGGQESNLSNPEWLAKK